MTPDELAARTKRFAIDVFKLVDRLPGTISCRTIGNQLAKSASSQAANYREAQRARSTKEFISKITISIQEAEESRFWLQSINELYPTRKEESERLLNECSQLVAIFTASARTASRNAKTRTQRRN